MSARDDYPYWPAPDERRFSAEGCWHWSRAMDEIDLLRATVSDADTTMRELSTELGRLRSLNARLERDFAEMNQLDPIVDRIGNINLYHGERDDDSGKCLCGREWYLACPYWPDGGVADVTWTHAPWGFAGENPVEP